MAADRSQPPAHQRGGTARGSAFHPLAFHRRLIDLRAREAALTEGSYAPFCTDTQSLAFLREHEGQRFLIAANLTHKPCHLAREVPTGEIVLSTVPEREGERVQGILGLSGDEGLIIRLDAVSA